MDVANVAENGRRRGRGQEVARIASRSGSRGGGGTERIGQAAGAAAESAAGGILLHDKVLLERGLVPQLLQAQLILSLPLGAASEKDGH